MSQHALVGQLADAVSTLTADQCAELAPVARTLADYVAKRDRLDALQAVTLLYSALVRRETEARSR